MTGRFSYLLTLLPWLYRHPGVSVSDAAAHFGRTREQFIEDVTLLSLVGIGQYAGEQFELSIEDDCVEVYDTLGITRAFKFDAMEAACLLLGLDFLDDLPEAVTGLSATEIDNLRSKLGSAIPRRAPITKLTGASSDAAAIAAIDAALKADTQLQFDYHNVARDDVLRRTVSPLRMENLNGIDQLRAFCHTSDGWRTFRLSAMSNVKQLSTSAEFPASGFEPMPLTEVQIHIAAHRQELLEQFSVIATHHKNADGITASVLISQPTWLARLVQSSGGGIRVVAPIEMVEAVAAHVDRSLTVYAG